MNSSKIFNKILANQIQESTTETIHHDQEELQGQFNVHKSVKEIYNKIKIP